MDELDAIERIDSIDTLKHKRATRCGQITRIHKKITTSLSVPLQGLTLVELEANSKEVQGITDIETALQNRLEQFLEGVPAELKVKLEESDKFETSRSGVLRQANQALIACQLYTEYQNLYADLEELEEDVDLASSHFQDLFSQFRTHVKSLHQGGHRSSKLREGEAFGQVPEGRSLQSIAGHGKRQGAQGIQE